MRRKIKAVQDQKVSSPEEEEKPKIFEGFPQPTKNFFSLPNEIINIIAHITNMAELKVILYILRHTWGFHEFGICKTISTDEFMFGRKRQDQSRMDEGTGLSNRSVIDGLRAAEEHGYIVCDKNSSDRARKVKSYALKMIPSCEDSSQKPPMKNLHRKTMKKVHKPPVKKVHSGREDSSHRSEKDTLERHFKKDTVCVTPVSPQQNDHQDDDTHTPELEEKVFPTMGDHEEGEGTITHVSRTLPDNMARHHRDTPDCQRDTILHRAQEPESDREAYHVTTRDDQRSGKDEQGVPPDDHRYTGTTPGNSTTREEGTDVEKEGETNEESRPVVISAQQIIAWTESITGFSLIRTPAILSAAGVLAEKNMNRTMLYLAMKCLTTDRWFADHRVEPDITWVVRRWSTCSRYMLDHIHEFQDDARGTPPPLPLLEPPSLPNESASPVPSSLSTLTPVSLSSSSLIAAHAPVASSSVAITSSLIPEMVRPYTFVYPHEPSAYDIDHYERLPERILLGDCPLSKVVRKTFPDFAMAMFPHWLHVLIATGEMTVVNDEGAEETIREGEEGTRHAVAAL